MLCQHVRSGCVLITLRLPAFLMTLARIMMISSGTGCPTDQIGRSSFFLALEDSSCNWGGYGLSTFKFYGEM